MIKISLFSVFFPKDIVHINTVNSFVTCWITHTLPSVLTPQCVIFRIFFGWMSFCLYSMLIPPHLLHCTELRLPYRHDIVLLLLFFFKSKSTLNHIREQTIAALLFIGWDEVIPLGGRHHLENGQFWPLETFKYCKCKMNEGHMVNSTKSQTLATLENYLSRCAHLL